MGLETLIATLIGTAALTMALMFLPAAIELLRPKDAGPRLIEDGIAVVTIMPITNIEERQPFVSPLNLKIPPGLLPAIANLEV